MAGYRRWTVMAGWWGVKLGPVTLFGYRWLDGRLRVSLSVLNEREIMLWGKPLA